MKQKLLASILIVAMLFSLVPAPVFAASHSYTAGAFTITSSEPLTVGSDYSCQNYSDSLRGYNYNVLTINTEKPITIQNTNPAQTHDSIVVADGVSAKITLAGVDISTYVDAYLSTFYPALQIADGSTGDVTITLADGTTNTLIGGPYKAGLQKNGGNGMLTIQGDSLGTGTLYVQGGGYGAGIGGAYQCEGTNITINRANVTAQGGLRGAGIGGGGSDSGISGQYGKASKITIIDSVVTAQGGDYAAGIGGGNYGSLSFLRISGGSVKAIAGTGAQTLGGGANSNVKYTPPTDNGTGTGHQLYLLTIANPTGAPVMIDGEEYSLKQHGSDDTNLYVYLSGTKHTVKATLTFEYTKAALGDAALTPSHTHVDSNGDDICDECSNETVTVRFDKNNDLSNSETMESIVLYSESSYTLPACAFTAPAGKYFKGWATERNGVVITGGAIAVSDSMTLYAIWGDLYTITFYDNGGSDTMSPEVVKEGTVYTLPPCTFTPPENYYLVGWAMSAAGDVITDETITVDKNIDLYAIWAAMPFDGVPTELDITYGNVIIGANTLDAYDLNNKHLTEPDYDGYIITGTSTSTAWNSRVEVKITGGSHKITLRNLSIDVSSVEYAVAFMIQDAQIELTLEGTNFLASGRNYAALNLQNESASATLTITADSTGSLTADGGLYAARIGPTNGESCGNITIAGGNISLVDDKNNDNTNADIGVGSSGNCGAITIIGGSFDNGDATANTVYGIAVPTGYEVKQGSGTYPYQVVAKEYGMTVTNGAATIGTGSSINEIAVGSVVTITAAAAPDGQQFKEWQVVSGNVILDDAAKATTTFTMPANAVEVKAIYENIPAAEYNIIVTYGTSSAEKAAVGTMITISAEDPAEGMKFKEWQVVSGNVTLDDAAKATTTFTMPVNAVEVKAIYEDIPAAEYNITVTNGTSSAAKAAEGTTIKITANAPAEGMKFKAWSTTPSALTFVNGTSTTSSVAEFTMPASAVAVEATYETVSTDGGDSEDTTTPGDGNEGSGDNTDGDNEGEGGTTPPEGDDEGEGGDTPSNPGDGNTPPSGGDEDDTTTPSTSGSSGFSGSYNYPVTVSPSDDGSAILSDSNAVAGESVTITTKPDKGYGAVDVIVADEDGNVIPVTDLGNGQYAFTMPEGEVNVEVIYKPAITMVIDSVYINVFGKTIKNDVAPIIVGDRTMLPIRVVAEALGADVDWDAELQKVTITKGDTVIELFIGETTAYVNGKAVQLNVAPFIDNDRTYLPVRFVSEYLGAVVHWDADTRTVTVIPE